MSLWKMAFFQPLYYSMKNNEVLMDFNNDFS